MLMFERHFSVEEANALLPDLRRWFGDLHALGERLDELNSRLEEKLEQRHTSDVGGAEFGLYLGLSLRWRRYVDVILATGVQVKDFDRGLVDFPHLLPDNGEEVFLCWQLGEPEVAHWHALHTGFAGRMPLDWQG